MYLSNSYDFIFLKNLKSVYSCESLSYTNLMQGNGVVYLTVFGPLNNDFLVLTSYVSQYVP